MSATTVTRHLSRATRYVLLLLFCAAPERLQAQGAVNIRHAIAPTASIRISGAFSELRIRGWTRDTVAITGSLPNESRFDGGFLQAAPGSASQGAKFFLESPSGVPNGKLELFVPSGARVWAKSGSAIIDADGVTGGLDL